jgi:hypothetical protein
MRLSVSTLRQVVKRDVPIAFVPQQLTSYGGLELLRRYLRRIDLPRRLHATCAGLGGDYSGVRLGLLLLALLYVGARRLEHLQYLVGDPLVRRFAGLARVPTARTVSNWLRRFTQETLRPLVRLNQAVVLDTLARLDVPRLTLDVDGTVGEVLELLDNEAGMHSCLEPRPSVAGWRRRQEEASPCPREYRHRSGRARSLRSY